jgi:hypothetical protein
MLNENENVDFLDTPSQESQDGPVDFDEEKNEVTDSEVPDQQNTTEQAPVALSFSHPHLRGKTEAEIESLFNLMQNTVQSQTSRINELSRAPAVNPEMSASQLEPKGDFFDDPLTHMRREMAAAVAPINQEIANLKAQTLVNSAWESVAMKFGDFDKYRSHVEVMLQNMGVGPTQVTPDLLESLYYGAKGYIQTHQASLETPGTPSAPAQRPPPPQHRPSAAPLPRSAGDQLRELTEDERRLAREFGLSHKEYLEWGSKDEGDVANAEEV